jgi:hypothetical protein
MDLSLETGIGLYYWARLAGLGGMLGFALWRAHRRWREAAEESPARRILYPCLAILLGFAIYLGLLTIFLNPFMIVYVIVVTAFWVAVPAFASVAILDLGAKLLRAERTGLWLAVGILAFVAVTFLWLVLTGIDEPVLIAPGLLQLEYLTFALIPAAAGTLWWAYLPGAGGGGGIEEAFE